MIELVRFVDEVICAAGGMAVLVVAGLALIFVILFPKVIIRLRGKK